MRREAEEQWAEAMRGCSGRCRPQTLQRFLSLCFNSMLPACHSDLRSVPVIRTAFRVGPKHQSCSRGGRFGKGGGSWAGEVHFQIDTGALHFHILAHSAQADSRGRCEKREFCLSGFFCFFNLFHKFVFPLPPLVLSICREGGYFG